MPPDEGPPPRMSAVVLLHGVPTSGALWSGVRFALGPGRRSFAPDLPGYGGGRPLPEPTLEAHLDWLEGQLDRAGLLGAPLDFVGHDYGGLLAAAWAARRGARSLVLTSTALGWGWLPARITAISPLNRYFYRRHAGRRWLALGVGPAHRDALFRTFLPEMEANVQLARQMEALARAMRLSVQAALAPGCPTLCLWGGADRSVPPFLGRRLAAGLPDARFVVLPGLRHYAMWEDPGAYAAALEAFWASVLVGCTSSPVGCRGVGLP